MSGDNFSVTFWGVRGSMPTPGAETLRYGGQTSCVQMTCGDRQLIFDAGTGLYPLGETPGLTEMDLFLSHTHIDHIQGFPFFSPVYREGNVVRVHAGHLLGDGANIRDTMAMLMSPPIFPLTLDFLKADLSFHDFHAGDAPDCPHLLADGIAIRTLPLNHPDCATGYRVDYAGCSACYITDIEHVRGGLDEALIAFIRDADLLIYDSTFDDRDFDRFVGWGHSTWQEAARLANAANVKTLALFHHDPGRTDDQLDAIKQELQAMRPQDMVAAEGVTVQLVADAVPMVKQA